MSIGDGTPGHTDEVRPRRFLRIADCAHELGCSAGHIRNQIMAERLPACRLDGLTLVSATDWDDYLDAAQPLGKDGVE